MFKLPLLAVFTVFVGMINAQFDVKWGELEKVKGYTTQILPISGSDFYTVRYQGGAIFGASYLGIHNNFTLGIQNKIQMTVGTGMATWEGCAVIGKEVVVFLSDKLDGKHLLYMQKYNESCKPTGAAIELASYNLPKTGRKKGYFNFLKSRNGEFFCVEYDIPGTKMDHERFGYKVLSTDLEMVSEGEYEVPFETKISEISNRYISNTGDYFISCNVYMADDKRRVKDYSTLDKVVLMHVTPEGLEEFELELDGKRIFGMSFSSDNDKILTFTGLYGNKAKGNGVQGIFYFRLDFDSKKIIDDGFEPFSKDFITEGWSEKEKAKSDKREAKGKDAPQFFDYNIRETVTLSDGSVIGMLEQYYVRVITNTDYRTGAVSTTYYYYYNDLIVYKIQPNGTFEWVKKIPKYQASVNDGGYLSSVARFVKGDNMYILFNDNINNYTASGDFKQLGKDNPLYGASFRKKTNVVAKVELDLKTGEYTRKAFTERNQVDALAIPKLFNVDYKNEQMLMIFRIGKKERFGLLDFKH